MVDQAKVELITAAMLMELEQQHKLIEVVHGQIREVEMAGELHGAIEMNLLLAIGSFVKANQLGRVYPGDTTFVLDGEPNDIRLSRLPDVAFVTANRLKTEDRTDYYYQAPDLAIEIISPSERSGEIQEKRLGYLRFGVRQVWEIYPETQEVIVYQPETRPFIYTVEDTIPGGDVLPGFELAVREIFA